ncbi:MAG: hypothetical protein ABIO70_12970 [Pseudomonadota bacterium]
MPAPRDPLVPRWLELSLYGAVALGAVLPALLQAGHVVGDGVDLYGTLWFFWWIQDALVHLHDPSFTDLFFHPLGKDIFAHTGDNFLDALLSVPLQWVFRFPRYQPVFIAVVLLGNALAFRPLAQRLAGPPPGAATPWWRQAVGGGQLTLAAFAATALWQASAYALFEINAGRPTQAFLWFLPLALDRFLALEGPDAQRRDAVALGLLVALQALVYWFMGHFSVLLFLGLAPWALWRSPDRRRLLRHYAVAALMALLAISPWLLAMLGRVGQGAVPGLQGAHGLLDMPPELANNVASSLHGYWLMERWGEPMLGTFTAALVLMAILAWGRDRVRWLSAAALTLCFAVGPAVQLDAERSLPWYPYVLAYNTVPFLDRLWFPYRGVVMVFLVGSTAMAGALPAVFLRLGSLLRGGRLAPVALVALLLGLNLAERHHQRCWPLVTRDVTPPAVFRWIGREGGGLIHMPFGVNQPAIIWQTVHHQPTFGGMGENAPLMWPPGFKDRLSNGLIRALRHCTRGAGSGEEGRVAAAEAALQADGFRWVVLHRDLVEAENRHRLEESAPASLRLSQDALERLPLEATHCFAGLLGEPVAVEGALVVWDLGGEAQAPEALQPTAESLETRTWAEEAPPAWEQVLHAQGRTGRAP